MEDSSMNSTNHLSKLSLSSASYSVPDDLEESGWTSYFEDSVADDCSEDAAFLSGCETVSMASQKNVDYHRVIGAHMISCERLSSKRRKAKTRSVDDDLEDTASSPLQSPTLNDLKQLYVKSKAMDTRSIYQDKGNAAVQAGEIGIGFPGMDGDCSELRKKGLCLVPVSILLNYLS
ncbi:hypothetical protein Ancab_004445 [Ancistrocladus abbreviatus]